MHGAPIENLVRKVGSVYKLVLLASMRAVELGDGAAKLVDTQAQNGKFINIALQEIAEGKISCKEKDK